MLDAVCNVCCVLRGLLDVWLRGVTNACAADVPQMIEAGCGTVALLSSDLSLHGKQESMSRRLQVR
jgi:NADP-dependent 3-hydroxy acid dehydrogenase YdfG